MRLPPAGHTRTIENVHALADAYAGPIVISVNGRTQTHHSRAERIAAMFGAHPNVSVLQLQSNTLAGSISGDLVGPETLTEAPRLGGCNRLASYLHVSVAGDVFMCCLDYTQKHKFGNIQTDSVADILSGPIARKYRQQVYGLQDAEADLICRNCCHIRK
jgi:radical SAM protein with 4Fe4S-binding SPASM domain